jgi:type IV secretory pathway TraG/TraD family ATPase VirD4
MGYHEILEIREGYSYGANDIRDGVTLNQERRKTPLIMDAEFLQLPNLVAYLKLAGEFPIAKVTFKFRERAEPQDGCKPRKMEDLFLLEKDNQDNTKSPVVANVVDNERTKNLDTKVPQTVVETNTLEF